MMTPNKAKEIVARDEAKALAAFDPYDVLMGTYPYEEYLLAVSYLERLDNARRKIEQKRKEAREREMRDFMAYARHTDYEPLCVRD